MQQALNISCFHRNYVTMFVLLDTMLTDTMNVHSVRIMIVLIVYLMDLVLHAVVQFTLELLTQAQKDAILCQDIISQGRLLLLYAILQIA